MKGSGVLVFVNEKATDPVVEEVRRIRRLYAERFGYDIHAMVDALRKEEQKHPQRLATFPSKPPRSKRSD